MSIFVVGSSKNAFFPMDDFRVKFIIDAQHDNDNIDFLNSWYCELTGLYYMWHHDKDPIVGLEHYRRFFADNNGNPISRNEAHNILNNYDIILRRFELPVNENTPWKHFANKRKPYLDFFLKNLDKQYRDYIIDAFHTETYIAQCNMFISNATLMNEYCCWLFRQLSKMPFDYFIKSPRIIGYLSEFVLKFYMDFHHKHIYWCPSITLSAAAH